jgi:DNA polymerase-3 subunit beta
MITIERKALHWALGTVARAVNAKTTLPILSNILLSPGTDGLELTATDLEIGVTARVAAEIKDDAASLTVPAKTLAELVEKLPDGPLAIKIEDGNRAKVTFGRSSYSLLGLPAEEYPPLPEVGSESGLTLPGGTLARLLRRVLPAVCNDDTRPILTAVEWHLADGRLRLAATDTHRVHTDSAAVTDTRGTRTVLVPDRCLADVARLVNEGDTFPVAVRWDENQIQFTTERVTLVSRLIEGTFPKWERIIPTRLTGRFAADRDDLAAAVRRVEIVARANGHKILLRAEAQGLTLTAQSGDTGQAQEELAADTDGEPLTFTLNAEYLADALAALGTERVTVQADAGNVCPPVLFQAEGDETAIAVVGAMQEV